MADTVTTITLEDYAKSAYAAYHFTGVSDGTGETNVAKIDKSAMAVAPDNAEPAALDILQVDWNIQGFSYIKLSWDHTTDDTAMVLPAGGGSRTFPNQHGEWYLKDPRSSGGTGDLLLTSVGAASGATYDITVYVKKAND
ncbi:MAG: hypothetical protein RI949_2305 [Pseudomonadota bacterium]|jgi:hypothetical protein